MEPDLSNNTPETQPEQPEVRKSRRGLYITIAAIAVLGYFGIAPRLRQGKMLGQEVEVKARELPLVSVVNVEPASAAASITLPSNIQAIESTNIQSQTSGYMKERFVDIGSKVTKGQLLAIIASPEVDQQLNATTAQVAQAQSGVGKAEADSANLKAAISAAKSEQVGKEAALAQSRANLAHLRAKAIEAHSAVNVAQSMESASSHKLAGAEADLVRAQARVTIAQKTLTRWQQLAKGDAVSGQDVDEKTADYQESEAQVDASRAAVSSAQSDVTTAAGSVSSAKASAQAADADVQAGQESVKAAQSAVEASKANVQAAGASFQASISNVGASQASLNSQRSNLGRVAAQQSFERIVAPFSGVITARNVDVGDLVSASAGGTGASDPMNTVTKTGLFGLARTDVLRVQANIPEDFTSTVHVGDPADVTVSEYPGKSFSGKVLNVSGALDAASRTLLVEIELPNPTGALKPGMYSTVRFMGARRNGPPQIPATTLIFDARGTRVAELLNNSVHYVTVSLGRDFGDKIEVLQGIRGGETLINNPDDSLQEGQKVEVAKQ
ncbi:MAG TPA: efflux RND transporter periplasmic adaptor subunit [Fimbriimonadaceae bacterium]|jgi:RND family efflux transporter MFP subunit